MNGRRFLIEGGVLVLCALSFFMTGRSSMAAETQSHDSIRQRAQQFIEAQLATHQHNDAQIEIASLDRRLRLRACAETLDAFATGNRKSYGAITVGVRCAGPKPWTLYVRAQVTVYQPVVVAARTLARNQPLGPGDLQMERRDISTLPQGYFRDPKELHGHISKRTLTVGTAVQPSQVSAPKWVERGQQVTLVAVMSGVRVSMQGKALEDGQEGQLVKVRNVSSERVVQGVVAAPGRVEVLL